MGTGPRGQESDSTIVADRPDNVVIEGIHAVLSPALARVRQEQGAEREGNVKGSIADERPAPARGHRHAGLVLAVPSPVLRSSPRE